VEAAADKIGPFTELTRKYGSAVWDTLAANVPHDLRWNWLLFMFALALTLFALRSGRGAKGADGRERPYRLAEYLLPREIYTHVSARVDVWLWVLERALKPLWGLLLLGALGPFVEKSVIGALTAGFGAGPAIVPNIAWMLVYSLVLLLCYDFTFFLLHYAEHKVPVLWAIHKVHHSAEVLTPLTRYREHVLEGPLYSIQAAIGYAVPAAVFGWMFAGSIAQATILDGFPLAKRGEAARALGAAFSASMLGGIFGAVVLTVAIQVARPLILGVGFGEQLMLIIFALTMVGMLVGDSAVKGLAFCGLGLMLGVEFRGEAAAVLKGLREKGILATKAGDKGLRLLPPLIIRRGEIKTLLVALDAVLKAGAGAPAA